MAIVDFSDNPSLNEIVSSLAARVDKTDDVGLMDELKHIVNYKRNAAVHNWLVSMPQSWFHFIQSFVAATEKVSATECAEFPSDCFIYRTVCEIPEPLRSPTIKHGWQIFDFVGSESGYRAYQWLQPEHIETLRYNKYTSNTLKWYWKNSRVYIVSAAGVDPGNIMLRSVFEDALSLQGCDICDSKNNDCISDDDPYPVPKELLDSIIKDILATELRVGTVPDEVKQAEDDIKVDSQEKIQHVNT